MILPTGSGRESFLRSPSMPAASMAAKPKYGLAEPSNDFISKLLTRPLGVPGGDVACNGVSLFLFPKKSYASLHVLETKNVTYKCTIDVGGATIDGNTIITCLIIKTV